MNRSDRDPSDVGFGLLAAGLGLCCGLPLLLGAGVAIGAAGFVLGSALLVAVGVGLGAWGWYRRRRRATCDSESVPDDRAHTPGGQL